MGKPIIFKQQRPGKNGRPFFIYKFRTLHNKCDKYNNLLSDQERISNFGNFLRSFSLDELPELFNILKGEMSFIGPRPLLMEYLKLYSADQFKRHNVKPGISGWAQVNGRNNITWPEKFELDLFYVKNISFFLDFKIFFLTTIKVFLREGINSKNSIGMNKFLGN